MMVPAHVLSGMVCLHLGQMVAKRQDGRTRWSNLPEWTWLALGLIFAFLSHAVVDTLAIFTYTTMVVHRDRYFLPLFFWTGC